MKNIQVGIKKGLSWVLTAALTVGFVSAAGVTVGADTVTLAERERNRTATASEAEKAKKKPVEEPLDEDGFLMDGEVVGNMAGNMAEAEGYRVKRVVD